MSIYSIHIIALDYKITNNKIENIILEQYYSQLINNNIYSFMQSLKCCKALQMLYIFHIFQYNIININIIAIN